MANKKYRCVNNTGVEKYVSPYEGKEFAMAKKKDTPVRLDQLTEEEKMKYEIADELGLLDRVMKDGWKSLITKRNRENWWNTCQKKEKSK